MGGVLDLFASFIPSWYNDFHTRRFSSFRSYLFLVLVVHTVLRAYTFCYIYHLDFFEHFSPIQCIGEFNYAFPNELTINIDSKTNQFYFEQNEHLDIEVGVDHSEDSKNIPTSAGTSSSDMKKDKTKFAINLPTCFNEAVGIAASYLSKSAMSVDGIWRRISPTIVLDNGKANANTNRYPHTAAIKALSNEKTNFLTIGQKHAYFLDFIPVTSLVTRTMKQLCSFRYSNNDYENDVESICIIDKRMVSTKLERVVQRFKHIFYSEGENPSGKDEDGKVLSMMKKVTDKRNFYVFFFIIMFSSLFSFTSLIDFIDLYVAAVLISWLIQFRWVRSLLFFRPQWDNNIRTLPTSFYFGLAIHTATPVLMMNSLLPYPYADLYGFSAFAHLGFAFYVLRFHILPSMSERGRNNNNNPNNNRPVNGNEENRPNHPPTEMIMYYNFMAQQFGNMFRNVSHLSFDEKMEWKYYLEYQNKIHSILSGRDSTLASKLTLVQIEMEHVSGKLQICAGIAHVWSCLNDVHSLYGTQEDIKGGPGFCYGVSSAGVYILLAWYDSPDSPVGIQVMSRFPGSIIVSREICPAFTFQPTKNETDALLQRIGELQNMLIQFGNS